MRAESMGMQDYIYRVVIPEEKVVEVKDVKSSNMSLDDLKNQFKMLSSKK